MKLKISERLPSKHEPRNVHFNKLSKIVFMETNQKPKPVLITAYHSRILL
jgi:hypothetical protein